MSAEDKIDNNLDNLAGKAKEFGGKITGDDRLESEGKADQAQAQIKDKIDDAQQAVSDGVNKIKDTVSGIADSFKKD